MDAPTADARNISGTAIQVDRSLLDRAKDNDLDAITRMFRQFMSPDEEVYFAEYCGLLGFWLFGTHSFACLTNRRLATLQVGAFGRVFYSDGFLEHQNSGAVHQPSLLKLYLWGFFAVLIGLVVAGLALVAAVNVFESLTGVMGLLAGMLVVALGLALALLTVMLSVRLYYALNKCGLVWCIREGFSVFVFTNRGKMNRANHLYRLSCQVRDERLKAINLATAGNTA